MTSRVPSKRTLHTEDDHIFVGDDNYFVDGDYIFVDNDHFLSSDFLTFHMHNILLSSVTYS